MSRQFRYYLFENFDPEQVCEGQENPRALFGPETDAIVSRVADFPAGRCPLDLLHREFSPSLTERLIGAGVFRIGGDHVFLDSPVFLRQDAPQLTAWLGAEAARLVGLLAEHMTQLRAHAAAIRNGFGAETNLYHVLCGMVFDGLFLDRLSTGGALAASRVHHDGLDYLAVLYEACPELDKLSNGLLCSWNRFSGETAALQSFGDSNGARWDIYRFLRLREQGRLYGRFQEADDLFGSYFDETGKETILAETRKLAETGRCQETCVQLLEFFGYCQGGKLCVPVFRGEDLAAIRTISDLVENCLYDEVRTLLGTAAESLHITAVRHGVPAGELCNELYHILFGFINEELISRGMVCAPFQRAGEGRYLKSVQLFGTL